MSTALMEIDTNKMEVPSEEAAPKKKSSSNKRMSVERIYQKKTQLEHILLRPDSYIGSTEPTTQPMWVWDATMEAIVSRPTTFTPGLYKIFDEILVNSADNKQRDHRMNLIKVNIDPEKGTITIWNNGRGIPIEMHKVEKMYVPSMIFGHLLTSSNYDDTEKKVTGGRNGFGAKLCNIFSSKFTVETASEGKKFRQSWRSNMSKTEEPKISDHSGADFTSITFQPDLAKFKMEKLDADTIALFTRRAYDMAGVCRGVAIQINGEKLKIKSFKDYVQLYLKGVAKPSLGEGLPAEEPPKIIHEIVNARWEIAVTTSEAGFQQSSFVNSIATTKGGTHVEHCVGQIVNKLMVAVQRKIGKGGLKIKPFQIKSHLWVFVNALIENPTFDSQTKENMTLRKQSFGSECELSDKCIKDVVNCGVLDNIMSWVRFKTEKELNKKTLGSKRTQLKGIPKLDDANDAGTAKSRDCTLIVTEGDSAKALAVAGLSVVGRDKYGVFPLKGKMLNVRDANHKQIMDNAEIGNLLKIIGLQFGKKYETEADLKPLRYGHLMIMADQDQDGSHIKGLVINFIHASWPGLLKLDFLEEFITPIVKVTKGSQSESFYSMPEFEEWKKETPNQKSWKTKYYKGLGSSTSKEGKEYFKDMKRHRIKFEYDGPASDQAIIMAFAKKMVNERKNWLTTGMEERKMRREAGLPEIYLYEKNTRSVTYREFVNKELILFSNADNERSIPSIVDGLKPGQRKVIFTCMKRKDKNEVKVAQLAGSVGEMSAYHHGEMSLMSTIVNLAQNYVGSNNLNLLQPIGQFGTRHLGGKDHASPRYIFTMLSPLARLVFPVDDDNLLNYLNEDNQRIEPEWYCPIIPMVLINGADGIGTGYSTKIPNYDIREVVINIRKLIAGEEPTPMIPSFKNFHGEVNQVEAQRFSIHGTVHVVDETTIIIDELPVSVWTQGYKETVMDLALHGNEKQPPFITEYKAHHTDTTVKFEVQMTEENLIKFEQEGLHNKFKLDSTCATSNMVLFDAYGVLRKYENVDDILREFYELRCVKYKERKDFLMGILEAEASKLENQARFILEKIDGKIVVENRTKRDVMTTLVERGFTSDPVKAWKATQERLQLLDDETEPAPSEMGASTTSTSAGGPDFQYLITMAIMSLSKEKKDELLRQRDEKRGEYETLMRKTPADLWIADLDRFVEELDRVEEQERQDDLASAKITGKASKSVKGRAIKKPPVKSKDIKKAFETTTKDPKKESIKKVKEDWDFQPVDETSRGSVKSEAPSEAPSEAASEPEVLSLADRMRLKNLAGGASAAVTAAVGAVVAPIAAVAAVAAKKKQSTLQFGKKQPATKKQKKKDPWDDDSDDEKDDDDDKIEDASSDEDMDVAPPPAREKVGGRTAATKKKKYVVSDGDDDDEDDSEKDDSEEDDADEIEADADSDDSFQPTGRTEKKAAPKAAAKKPSPKVPAPKPKSPVADIVDSDESDNEEVASTRALIEKLSPMKKKPAEPKAKAKQSKLSFGVVKKSLADDISPADEKMSILIGDDSQEAGTSQETTTTYSQESSVAGTSQESSVTVPTSQESTAAPAKKKRAPNKKKTDGEVAPKKPAAEKKKAPTKSKSVPAKGKSVAEKRKTNSDDDSDDEAVAHKSKAPTKSKSVKAKAAVPKKKKKRFGDSDDDTDDESFRVGEKKDDDSDAAETAAAPVAPRATTGRGAAQTKKPKYSFSSDEDEEDSDSDF